MAAEARQTQPRGRGALTPRRLLLGLLGSVLLGALVTFLLFSKSAQTPSLTTPLRVGQPAPEFEVLTLAGERLKLSDLKGKPVWLNFWATWCEPCRAEMPELVAEGQAASRQGVQLLAIDVGEDAEEVQGYLSRGRYESLPAVLDPDGSVARKYRAFGYPIHVFIDSEGRIQQINAGRMDAKSMRQAIGRLQ